MRPSLAGAPDIAASAAPLSAIPSRTRLGWASYLAIALGLLLALALTGAAALLAARNEQLLKDVARTESTRAALADVLANLQNAETGQRGFLLTGKESYLGPYTRGAAELPGALDALEANLRNSPTAATALPLALSLRPVVNDKLAELAETLALARANDRAGALDTIQSDRGQSDMRAARLLIADLSAGQRRLLADQIADVNAGGRLLVRADALGFVLLALLALAIAWGAAQAFRTLRTAQASLAGVNDQLEQRVAERTAALTEANEEIQRFAYIVSHDLRAPLVNIMGFTSEMATAAQTVAAFVAQHTDPPPNQDVVLATTEDIPESLAFIKTSTAKMDRLIGAILKLSREGRRVLSPEPVALGPFLENIIRSMQHQADERGATVTIGSLPDITTDRLVLEQIFSNLIENALKYLQPGRPGAITVTGRTDGATNIYEVKDNGRGIAARDLERVFELFRRAGDQTVPGEGIGLAHVRALVRRLGGRIDCVSAPGVGSTFRIELPRTPLQPAPAPAPAPAHAPEPATP